MEEALKKCAQAIEAIPVGMPLGDVFGFVEKHVLDNGGTKGAAKLAVAIVRMSIRMNGGLR